MYIQKGFRPRQQSSRTDIGVTNTFPSLVHSLKTQAKTTNFSLFFPQKLMTFLHLPYINTVFSRRPEVQYTA